MNKLVLLCLGFALSGCGAINQQHQQIKSNVEQPVFKSEIDKFTGQKSVAWMKMYYDSIGRYANGKQFNKIFHSSKKPDDKKPVGVININSDFGEHKYLRCHSVDWLADGEIVKPLHAEYESRVERSPHVHVNEGVSSYFAFDSFKKLAGASRIEYRICNDEFQMTPEELEALGHVFNEITK